MSFRGTVFLFIALLLATNTARAEITIEAYSGMSSSRPSDLRLVQQAAGNDATFHDMDVASSPMSLPIYYGLRLGYFLDRLSWLGMELELIHDKAVFDTAQQVPVSGTLHGRHLTSNDLSSLMDNAITRFEITHGANHLLVNLLARHGWLHSEQNPHGRLQVVARLGVGPGILHVESTGDGQSTSGYQIRFPSVGLGLGATWRLWWRVHLLAEYKLTTCRAADVAIVGGLASTSLIFHHLNAGLGIKL